MDTRSDVDRNEEFVKRLMKRRPEAKAHYERRLQQAAGATAFGALESAAEANKPSRETVLETIVFEERPVLFIKDGQFNTTDVAVIGQEAAELVNELHSAEENLLKLLPLIGRVDVVNFGGADFLGTAWLVDVDIAVTNRHVAKLIAERDGQRFVFSRGVGNTTIIPSWCTAHEYDDLSPDATRIFEILEVLYIEPDNGKNDIAFLRVKRRVEGNTLPYIRIADADIADNDFVCVIGYPARAPRSVIQDQNLMQRLFLGKYDVKRAAPGLGMRTTDGTSEHDCTTLGGNSGSIVVNKGGKAAGLHFAGLYKQANFAVPASVLREYVETKRWNSPIEVVVGDSTTKPEKPGRLDQPTKVVSTSDTSKDAKTHVTLGAPTVVMTGTGPTSVTIPLTISVSVGTPVEPPARLATSPDAAADTSVEASHVESAVAAYWDSRPPGILAARVGYFDEGQQIGDRPCIAASVPPSQLAQFESTAPRSFQGVPILYVPATVDEQIAALPAFESVDSIAYDDDARTGKKYSFDPVDEEMEVLLHVGPEYSWDTLHEFLSGAEEELVSAMYEFHGPHIKDAIEERLKNGVSMEMVLDNATFSKVRNPDVEFERAKVFEKWAGKYKFERIVAPEGIQGLISDSYHIKVTVREDDTFWLSSGNWKEQSSQPIITQEQRDNFEVEDLPGNREWHVVIKNKTLATRFRSHIRQDFKRSRDLGGAELPKSQLEAVFVDVPIEEALDEAAGVLERKPPSKILKPKRIRRRVKVHPLLTPDQEGAIFSEAVLELIRSAESSLLFQIPYIGMPPNPRDSRGFIDDLIKALVEKLKTLDDARVILRSQGNNYSSPTHAAWHFKSKGVDIKKQLKMIDDHHTKGMIVDGRRLLLGSTNWSKPGVSLNRDASLIFDDEEVAAYYAEAFEVDWARARPITPRRFVRDEATVLEAVGPVPPIGYRRVPLSELLQDD